MSYGFEAKNAANEVVLDSSFPVYELGAATTVTSNLSNSDQTAWSFPLQPTGTLRFWQLNIGDGISIAPNQFIGSKQTFTVRDVVPASSFPTPTGYGMAIYGPNGQKVYATNGELLTIGDKYTVELQPGNVTPSINVSDSWVTVETFVLNLTPQTGFFGVVRSSGVRRSSSTQMQYYGVPFSSAPPDTLILNPVNFITAK